MPRAPLCIIPYSGCWPAERRRSDKARSYKDVFVQKTELPLPPAEALTRGVHVTRPRYNIPPGNVHAESQSPEYAVALEIVPAQRRGLQSLKQCTRSEERRVGKECRSRW